MVRIHRTAGERQQLQVGELTPYWSERLGKTSLLARQLSKRGAELTCRLLPGRVELGGHCVTYLHGTLRLNALRSYALGG